MIVQFQNSEEQTIVEIAEEEKPYICRGFSIRNTTRKQWAIFLSYIREDVTDIPLASYRSRELAMIDLEMLKRKILPESDQEKAQEEEHSEEEFSSLEHLS